MSKALQLDYETGDRIAVCVMRDQLAYLRKEQEWFEATPEGREKLTKELGYGQWVHPDDYALNRDKYIPALETLIKYFGG